MATINGDAMYDGALSFLPGQKLSRCTCPGESHPGPMHSDGTYVGRAAPEIDIFEAQVAYGEGEVSQSCQWAVRPAFRLVERLLTEIESLQPFNYAYEWFNTSANLVIYDDDVTHLNLYKGGAFQQATSGVSITSTSSLTFEELCS